MLSAKHIGSEAIGRWVEKIQTETLPIGKITEPSHEDREADLMERLAELDAAQGLKEIRDE